MRWEVRGYLPIQKKATILARSKHQDPLRAAGVLADKGNDRADREKIALAVGIGYAAFGIGQRDLDKNGEPTSELAVSLHNTAGIDVVVIETNVYEADTAMQFHRRNSVK